jgi:queuine tRNA-ribosyltransferase
MAGEMLGPILASIHNLTFYQRLVARLRAAVVAGRLTETLGELRAGLAAPERAAGAS